MPMELTTSCEPAHHTASYLNDTVAGAHVCIHIDIIRYFRKGRSVIVCIDHPNIDSNWLAFLHTIKCRYLRGEKNTYNREVMRTEAAQNSLLQFKTFLIYNFSFKWVPKCSVDKRKRPMIVHISRGDYRGFCFIFHVSNSKHILKKQMCKIC